MTKDGMEALRVGMPTYCPHHREVWDVKEREETEQSFLEEDYGELACSTCCSQERGTVKLYSKHNPLLLQLRHSLRGQLVLQTPTAMTQERTGGLLTHAPAISFETDSTVECTSKKSPESRDKVKVKLANMARLGRTKKSWL
ncbi:gap junction delta-2 protein-like [Scomber scombrus]|uniref:Gap junction delta-2 protein-like n=1 Tax=Scomber scombrus TaxID=13677 RepID=A0AAV1QAY3_SCOSC